MPPQNNQGRPRTLESLVELVAALDRRVPHAERSAEARIAEDSSELRAEASLRIDELRSAAQTPDVVAQPLSTTAAGTEGPESRQR